MDSDENTSLLSNSRRSSQAFLDQHGSFKGSNSLQNFASSFVRSTSFAANKIDNDIHKKRSFFTQTCPIDGGSALIEDETFDPEFMIPSYKGERLSSVIHDLQSKNSLFLNNANEIDNYLSGSNNEIFYHDDILKVLNDTRSRQNSNSNNPPGAIPIKKQRLFKPQSFSSLRSNAISLTPSIISFKKIEDENGNIVTILQGQSTAPQTIFNSVNVLIGVGLLALPSMMNLCGWVLGISTLLICGLTTCYTASLLSKSMDTDKTIMTYADLGYAAYGSKAKLIISLLFSIDLLGAGVSLIVLFSDSLYALIGNNQYWNKTDLKLISFVILTPFTFLPLSLLSVISLFGIISTISITFLIFICGLIKQDSPGSLIQFMSTNIFPSNWMEFLVGISLAMAPFGGHAIFPNLKSDMKHPYKFNNTLKYTYSITIITDLSMAIIGYLMYGNKNSNEITNTLLLTKGYPIWVYPLISGLICLVPLAKTPLNAKPIISTLNSILITKNNNILNSVISFSIKIGVNFTFVVLAILFPEFDKILGMLGASICFIICNILPSLFYLKLCKNINIYERLFVQLIIIISSIIGIFATYAVIIY
ncbi:unnamed protein product [Candida verbasci]|uniref:Amino acid transporter transmembrane domain-containing protein n=1 Tax=Candida verbasci TaxID=1227364 RepID=A0A9W4XCB5_9ASCO|nr:unnamed protein product [Candida verbasci]